MTPGNSGRHAPGTWPMLALAALLIAGCGGSDVEPGRMARRTLTLDEVPQTAVDAASKALPGITFDEAWGNVDRDGTLNSYEIRGRAANGRIGEVRVTANGEVLEVE